MSVWEEARLSCLHQAHACTICRAPQLRKLSASSLAAAQEQLKNASASVQSMDSLAMSEVCVRARAFVFVRVCACMPVHEGGVLFRTRSALFLQVSIKRSAGTDRTAGGREDGEFIPPAELVACVDAGELNKVFLASSNLGSDAIVHFAKAVAVISLDELRDPAAPRWARALVPARPRRRPGIWRLVLASLVPMQVPAFVSCLNHPRAPAFAPTPGCFRSPRSWRWRTIT